MIVYYDICIILTDKDEKKDKCVTGDEVAHPGWGWAESHVLGRGRDWGRGRGLRVGVGARPGWGGAYI